MNSDPLYREFGRLVRGHRRRLGLTQDQVGERIGLSRTSITNIERGRQKVLLHQLFMLAESLQTDPEALVPKMQTIQTAPPHIEQKLPKDLTGPEREWVRGIMAPSAREGGTSHGVKD